MAEQMASPALARLHAWLSSQRDECEFPSVYVSEDAGGSRGVYATTPIEPRTTILRIGKPFLITVELAVERCTEARELHAAIEGGRVELSAERHCLLSVFLLVDRRDPSSFFAPYYAVLPDAFPGSPVFWPADDLDVLEGSYFLQQVRDRRTCLVLDYHMICEAVPSFGRTATLNDFMWARAAVASRNFSIVVDGKKTDALVPLADMLNHRRPRQTSWGYDSTKNAFVVHALSALAPHGEIFDSYGRKCNSRFLLNYGFTVENNVEEDTGQDHNEVRHLLALRSPQEDPYFLQKLKMLGTGQTSRSVRVSTYYESEGTGEAFSYLRFVHAKGNAELAALPAKLHSASFDWNTCVVEPISARNELAVLAHLARLGAEQLAEYTYAGEVPDGITTYSSGGGGRSGSSDSSDAGGVSGGDGSSSSSNVSSGNTDADGRGALWHRRRRDALILLRGETRVCSFYVKLERAVARALAPLQTIAAQAVDAGVVAAASPSAVGDPAGTSSQRQQGVWGGDSRVPLDDHGVADVDAGAFLVSDSNAAKYFEAVWRRNLLPRLI